MTTERLTRRLPDSWIRRIFAELQGHYGSRFLDMWRSGQMLEDGRDAGLENAMETWAVKLGGFYDEPMRIKKALGNLPQHPPTLPEFVALCRQGISDAQRALPAPRPSRVDVAPRIAELMHDAKRAEATDDFLSWARKPPMREFQSPWESAICECVERGDTRFEDILAMHVQEGVMRSERAKALVLRNEEPLADEEYPDYA